MNKKESKIRKIIAFAIVALVGLWSLCYFGLLPFSFGDSVTIHNDGTGTLTCYVHDYNDGKTFTISQDGKKTISLSSIGKITQGACYCAEDYLNKRITIDTSKSFTYHVDLACEGGECTHTALRCFDNKVQWCNQGTWQTTVNCDTEYPGTICTCIYGDCDCRVGVVTTTVIGCTSRYTKECYNNDVYWYDSCGNRGGKYTECGSAGCYGGECKEVVTTTTVQEAYCNYNGVCEFRLGEDEMCTDCITLLPTTITTVTSSTTIRLTTTTTVPSTCEEGRILIDGKCVCESGTFEMDDTCYPDYYIYTGVGILMIIIVLLSMRKSKPKKPSLWGD